MSSLAIALIAGGLSTVNPCGFALLPAFLTFYVGADDEQLPNASSRSVQGLKVGTVVAGGFITVFAVIGLPLALGASVLTRSIPWFGISVGIVLIALGVAMFAGKKVSVSFANPVRVERDRRLKTMFTFGIGYGIASLGCTLPVFLAVIGASSSSSGVAGSLTVFAGYGAGMALVMVVLSLAASMVRAGIANHIKRSIPYMSRVAGLLILVTGAYLTYYWVRVRFGAIATLADDPLVGLVERFSASVQRIAASNGRWIILIAAMVVTFTVLMARSRPPDDVADGDRADLDPGRLVEKGPGT